MVSARTPRRNGPYAPLSAFYAEDDAVIALEAAGNDLAELLFLRALAYCAREPKLNGCVSRLKLSRLLNRPVAKLVKAAQSLVDVGLWEQGDDGWRIRQWNKWNRSAEEVAYKQQQDRDRKGTGTVADSGGNAELSGGNPPLSAHQSIALHGTTRQGTSLHLISDGPSRHASASTTTDHQLSHQETTDLVAAVVRLRPDWQEPLIRHAAKQVVAKSGSLRRSTMALLLVASAADSKTPHRALEDGWWWCESDSRYQSAVTQMESVA